MHDVAGEPYRRYCECSICNIPGFGIRGLQTLASVNSQ